MQTHVSLGLIPVWSHTLKTGGILDSIKIGDSEHLLLRENEMIHVASDKQVNAYKRSYRFGHFIPELNCIVVVSCDGTMIIMENKREFPVMSDSVKLQSSRYNQIAYSSSSNALFVGGETIEIMYVTVSKKRYGDGSDISFTTRESLKSAFFRTFSPKFMLDEERKKLTVFTKTDLSVYSFEGKIVKNSFSLSSTELMTVSLYNSANVAKRSPYMPFNVLISSDCSGELVIRNETGKTVRVIENSETVFVFLELINSEFAVGVSKRKDVFIIDLKTGKFLMIDKLTGELIAIKLYDRSTLVVTTNLRIDVYEVVIPWKLFAKTEVRCVDIKPWASGFEPSRIGLIQDNGAVSFLSPTTGKIVSAMEEGLELDGYLYDRGGFRYKERFLTHDIRSERLICSIKDGSVIVYSPSGARLVMADRFTLRAMKLTFVRNREGGPFVIGFMGLGDLVRYNLFTFQTENRVPWKDGPPIFAGFHFSSCQLFAVYPKKVIIVEPMNLSVVETRAYSADIAITADLSDDMLVIGYEGGTVTVTDLQTDQSETLHVDGKIEHVASGYGAFVVLTNDGAINVGRGQSEMATFVSPFEVQTAGFLNADLDLLVALDSEIMVVRRQLWFPWVDASVSCPEIPDYSGASTEKASSGDYIMTMSSDKSKQSKQSELFRKRIERVNEIVTLKQQKMESTKSVECVDVQETKLVDETPSPPKDVVHDIGGEIVIEVTGVEEPDETETEARKKKKKKGAKKVAEPKAKRGITKKPKKGMKEQTRCLNDESASHESVDTTGQSFSNVDPEGVHVNVCSKSHRRVSHEAEHNRGNKGHEIAGSTAQRRVSCDSEPQIGERLHEPNGSGTGCRRVSHDSNVTNGAESAVSHAKPAAKNLRTTTVSKPVRTTNTGRSQGTKHAPVTREVCSTTTDSSQTKESNTRELMAAQQNDHKHKHEISHERRSMSTSCHNKALGALADPGARYIGESDQLPVACDESTRRTPLKRSSELLNTTRSSPEVYAGLEDDIQRESARQDVTHAPLFEVQSIASLTDEDHGRSTRTSNRGHLRDMGRYQGPRPLGNIELAMRIVRPKVQPPRKIPPIKGDEK